MNYSSKLCKEVKTPSKDTSNLPICATLQEYKKKNGSRTKCVSYVASQQGTSCMKIHK